MSENQFPEFKCPLCGAILPKPALIEGRLGYVVQSDGSIGESKMFYYSRCPTVDCSFVICKESSLTKNP